MEIVAFTLAGIILYLFCDWALRTMEKIHGAALPYRNVVFFVLIMTLSLSCFTVIRMFMGGDEGAQNNYQEQQATDG
jgi:hypothetical protein